MTGPVVVGYDESTESAAAVRWAAIEAVSRAVPLDVVHVWGFLNEPYGGAGTSLLGSEVVRAVQSVADAGADVAREAAPGVEVHAVVHHGWAADVLVHLSGTASLVVLGRRGSGRFAGGILGSVTHGVLQVAHCPVVVVPGAGTHDDLGTARGSVVAGLDGSPGAYIALEAAAVAARVRGSDVRVLTAWSPMAETHSMTYWTVAYPDLSPGEVALQRAEHLQAEAETWWSGLHADVPVEWEVTAGSPVDVLVEASRDAALVVVGARGRGGLASLLLGSVSRGVVHRAHAPVMVTRVGTHT